MKKRLVLKKKKEADEEKEEEILGPKSNSPFREFDQVKREVDSMSDIAIRAFWIRTFGKEERVTKAPLWILKTALMYKAQSDGFKRTGIELSENVRRRFSASLRFSPEGMRKAGAFLAVDYNNEENTQGGSEMGNKKGSKAKSGLTASEIFVRLLSMEKAPGDESIIKQVKDATGSTKFDTKQLAWYKWKFRQGKLKGQDGKSAVISQPDAKKPKAAKKGKKKIVLKKKKKKK